MKSPAVVFLVWHQAGSTSGSSRGQNLHVANLRKEDELAANFGGRTLPGQLDITAGLQGLSSVVL